VVREVEIGTIGLLLSRPVSRARILWSFALVHLAELAVPLVLVSAAIPWLAGRMLGEEVALAPMLAAAAHATAFVSAVYAIALLFSVLLAEQVRVAAAAGGVCVVSFLLYFVEATRPFTLYALSSIPTYALLAQGQPYPWPRTAACLAIAAACLAAATLAFRRKDY
jgi:ABC-type transport system involved in multi-copper enzyme maturation permease subunit